MPFRWDEHEHRWGDRVRLSMHCTLSGPTAASIDGRLRNVSLSGALIMTDLDLPLNSVIGIRLGAELPAPAPTVVEAQITRKIHGNIGVEWCEFAPHAVKQLLRSIAPRM